jgi:multiple sugar transport system permease protein
VTSSTLTRGAGAVRTASAPRRRGSVSRSRARAGLLLVSPAIVLVGIFFILPTLLMSWMSLNNWPLLGATQRFIGAENYVEAVGDSTFGQSLLFTLKYTLIVTPIQLVLGYALAVFVRTRFRGVGFFRTSFFLPVVVGFASGAYIFLVLVQPESGLFDRLLALVGIQGTPWITDPDFALATVILMITWKTVGTTVILLMVGMQAVPEEIGEAARMDGAGWFQRELFITLPLLRSSIALVLILTLTGSFLAFDQFFVMTHGGPSQSTVTVVMWIYTSAFVRYRLGYSAALSIVLLLLLIVFSVIQIRALRERSET